MPTAEVGAYLEEIDMKRMDLVIDQVSNSTWSGQIILKFQCGPHAIQAVKRLSTVIKIERTVKNT
jgi:hypothetical protein